MSLGIHHRNSVAAPPLLSQRIRGPSPEISSSTDPFIYTPPHLAQHLPSPGKRQRGDDREFFIDNLMVRIHFIIVMIRWTGLAPSEFEFPFPGSLTSTFLEEGRRWCGISEARQPRPLLQMRGPRLVTWCRVEGSGFKVSSSPDVHGSGDTTPCKVTPVILHGVVSPDRSDFTRGCIPRTASSGAVQIWGISSRIVTRVPRS